MREFYVGAANFHGTYKAGRYVAETAQDAIDQARRDYANSPLGRSLHDVGAFRFFIEESDDDRK